MRSACARIHAPDLRELAATVTTARVHRARALAHAPGTLALARPLTHMLLNAPSLNLKPALRKLVAERPPDVVLALCSSMARIALEAPLDATPLVLDLIDVDSEKWAALARSAPIPRRWIYAREARCLARFEAAAAQRAHATLVANDRKRALLSRLTPGAPVHVVPNGMDWSIFRPECPPASEAHVMFCGVMNYERKTEAAGWLAEDVWPLVRWERRDARDKPRSPS